MALLGACATLLAACTFTPWQSSLGRPGDDSGADAAVASSDVAAPSSAEVTASAVPLATPVVMPTSKAVAESPAAGAAKDLYRVKAGDTLTRIAAAHGQRAADIAAWNKLPASGQVNVGQMLRVAPPVKGTAAASAPVVPAVPVAPVAAAAPATASDINTSPAAAKPRTAAARLAWPMHGSVATAFAPGKSRGIVIAGAPGEPVKAAAAGRVTYAGSGIQGYGKLIIVKHNAKLLTAYGRNGRLLVKQGDTVKPGQTIATSGADSAGVGTLLFEVRENGKPVDPMDWLPRPQS
ncbi:LysM peptidoglycan-binding domain-containing M23 family metallopeptidase [Paraburkholderia bannensis]|uniref:LysM peptidoglycan-binding domain-containing M23 family metallopeptidase n=1 Tax=Paraburkholderia bannensis TaxID=765414 RepID=UPI002AB6DC6A|nr:LysM peptidoglycan-binding domain-containing M23 family metallopeptidase [Paraburkholderia bannensis]